MLTLAASFASLLAVVAAKQALTVEVAAPSDFTLDVLQLTTSVVNTGDEEITLLKDPRTPLSAFATNTFAVASQDSGAIPEFKGVLVRPAPASELEHVVLAPGESFDVTHEVGKYYNFTSSGAGAYSFEPVNTFLAVAADGTTSNVIAETKPATVTLENQLVSTADFAPASLGGVDLKAKLRKRASFVSCSTTRQTQINSAITAAASLATRAVNHLTANPSGSTLYTTWFGAFVAARYNTVLANYRSFGSNPASWTYDCTCTESGTYAYVYPATYGRVYLCGYFWQAPATGAGSRADTIIHEGTHFPRHGGTDDWAYGQSACRSLATSNPARAVDNADNYAFFSVAA